ncbi:hypothetical protein F5Y13DRAFT_203300 [Hypoxylon sp. FL1857]|nr:hypothetical protein F5Y13DRAFT_203300 [Hypoxylon sp. FL1857]
MSLHRWSLPNRAFNREKSKDSDSSLRGRFPTIHIGNPGTRRRANLSSAFASLFEKDENRLNARMPDDARLPMKEIQPLSARMTNIPSPSRLKDAKYDTGIHRPDTPIYLIPKHKVVEKLSPKEGEVPKECNLTIPLHEGDQYAKSLGVNTPEFPKSPTSASRIRSASSSYPSEGIRSPPENCLSPQLNTWSESFMSELSLHGPYPSKQTSNESTIETKDISNLSDRVGQCLMEELAAAGGISDTDTRTTSRDYTFKPPLSDIISVGSPQEQRYKQPGQSGDPVVETTRKASDSAPCRDVMHGMLCGQGSSTSAVHGSYPELLSSIEMSSSDDDVPFRPSKTGSTDRLRLSTETGITPFSNIEGKNQGSLCNNMPASMSRKRPPRDIITLPISRSDNQPLSGLRFRDSNGSSTTLVQRIQKFKFRKWFKKVCLRTKVRFDNVVKQEMLSPSSPKALGRKKSKSQKPRRPKKLGGSSKVKAKAKSKSAKFHTKPPKVAKKTGKISKKREGKTHRFIRSLKKKNSVQLPSRNKSDASHRRVQSCPA